MGKKPKSIATESRKQTADFNRSIDKALQATPSVAPNTTNKGSSTRFKPGNQAGKHHSPKPQAWKGFVTTMIAEGRERGTTATDTDIRLCLRLCLTLRPEQLEEVINNPASSAIERIVCAGLARAVSDKEMATTLNVLLPWILGKPRESVDVNVTARIAQVVIMPDGSKLEI